MKTRIKTKSNDIVARQLLGLISTEVSLAEDGGTNAAPVANEVSFLRQMGHFQVSNSTRTVRRTTENYVLLETRHE